MMAIQTLPCFLRGLLIGAVFIGALSQAIASDSAQTPIQHRAFAASHGFLLAPTWEANVISQGHARIDNIHVMPSGIIYATLENGAGKGELIAIQNHKTTVLLSGLNRPDGLIHAHGTLYLTEEVPNGRILTYRISDKKVQTLATAYQPEGLAFIAPNQLIIAEDSRRGRLLHLSDNGLKVWFKGLSRPEGVCFDAAKQTLYVAETATGRILAIQSGKASVLIKGLHQPDQVACANDGSIWITEDLKSARLLRYTFRNKTALRDAALQVVAKGLNEPQGISFGNEGQVYVAEQGRGRILRLQHKQ